jgi:hypothetical protein
MAYAPITSTSAPAADGLEGAGGRARAAGRAAVVLWAVVLSIFASIAGIRHWVSLPRPTDTAALGAAMASLRGPADLGTMVVHVLFAECRCSRRVVDALAYSRAPVAGRPEKVLLVGALPEAERALAGRGIEVVHASAEELLARYQVESAPLFVVVSEDGRVKHVGGYTAHKQALVLRDRTTVDALERGETPAALPVFGCPVSDRLRRATFAEAVP